MGHTGFHISRTQANSRTDNKDLVSIIVNLVSLKGRSFFLLNIRKSIMKPRPSDDGGDCS